MPSLLLRVEPDVPEVHVRSGLVPLYVLAARVEPEVIADADARGLRVEDALDLLPERLALLRVELPRQLLAELLLLRVAPPARPVAQDLRRGARLRHERERRAEDLPELRLAAPLHDRRPVGHL